MLFRSVSQSRYQGSQGFQGNQGWQGLIGLTGSQGNQGNVGAQGNQGLQGNQGAQGFEGTQGAQGWQGFIGLTGFQGNQGEGAQGFQGNQGLQGLQGNQGTTGISDKYQTISLSTITIPTVGSTVSFTIETDLSYTPNQTVILSPTIDPVDHFHGIIISYNSSTGLMVVECTETDFAGETYSFLLS